jgi:hypothetical protein
MIPDAPVIRAGYGTKLGPTVMRLERLHLLAPVGDQAMLQIDARERRWQLTQIGRGSADQTTKLAE